MIRYVSVHLTFPYISLHSVKSSLSSLVHLFLGKIPWASFQVPIQLPFSGQSGRCDRQEALGVPKAAKWRFANRVPWSCGSRSECWCHQVIKRWFLRGWVRSTFHLDQFIRCRLGTWTFLSSSFEVSVRPCASLQNYFKAQYISVMVLDIVYK